MNVKWKRWNKQQDQFIRKNYHLVPVSELATALGRPKQGIRYRARKLGLVGKTRKSYLAERLSEAQPLELTEFDCGYIVGLYEGEGYIGLEKQRSGKIAPIISVTNTKYDIVKRARDILCIGYEVEQKPRADKNCNQLYRYVIKTYLEAYRFAVTFIPFMVTKQRQLQIILDFIQEWQEQQFEGKYDYEELKKYMTQMREVNKKGLKGNP